MTMEQLRRGWTTGACATAATRAAYNALLTGIFPDPVIITLPKGETPSFPLVVKERGNGWARAGVVKDAGDDPDATHGALIISTVRPAAPGTGITFRAGEGVGMVTRAGLPVPPGEPAINPVPRQLMTQAIGELSTGHGTPQDVEIEISVPGGAELARKTWNPRLGIVGGISILGTTGIVHPFSCSAWIHSIHRGIDVARAAGLAHIAGSTGATSEKAVQLLYDLPEHALIDMGDFVGGMLKYLRAHPVPRISIAGGVGKLAKLARGALDLHSGRSQVDFTWLAELARELGASASTAEHMHRANTAMEAFEVARGAGLDLVVTIAARARETAQRVLGDAPVDVDIVVVDRAGSIIGHAG